MAGILCKGGLRMFQCSIFLILILLAPFAVVAQPVCVGNCNGDHAVTVDELLALVNIALGTTQPSTCPHGIPSGAVVDVGLVIQAVSGALTGCSPEPSATPTHVIQPTECSTPTLSPTSRPSATPSASASPTSTPSVTPSATATRTQSATSTRPVGTLTRTPTNTRTGTPTRTPTVTATATRTMKFTPSSTPSGTATLSPSATGTPKATFTPDPNAPSVSNLSASCSGVYVGGTVAGLTTYGLEVRNAPVGAFVKVREYRRHYACVSDQYTAICRGWSPCVQCAGWKGTTADWGVVQCPVGHNLRRPDDPSSTTCTVTITGDLLSDSGGPFRADSYLTTYSLGDRYGGPAEVSGGGMLVECPSIVGQVIPVRTFLPSPTAVLATSTPTPDLDTSPTPTPQVSILSTECGPYNHVRTSGGYSWFQTHHRLKVSVKVRGAVGARVRIRAPRESWIVYNDADPVCANGDRNCVTCSNWTGQDPSGFITRSVGDPEEAECTMYFITSLRRYPTRIYVFAAVDGPSGTVEGSQEATVECLGSSASVDLIAAQCDYVDDGLTQRHTITARVSGPPGSSFKPLYRLRSQGSGPDTYIGVPCARDRQGPCAPDEDCVRCEGWHGTFDYPCPGGDARAEGDPLEAVCSYTSYISPSDFLHDPYDMIVAHTTAYGPSYADEGTLTCEMQSGN